MSSSNSTCIAAVCSNNNDSTNARTAGVISAKISAGISDIVENMSNFNPATEAGTGDATDKSKDKVTKFVYDGPSRLKQLVAMDANADGNLSDNQVTTYLYEDAIDANRRTNEIYPDSSDTTSSGTNQVKFAYNIDGSLSQRTDQRGTVLAYAYTNNRLPKTQSVSIMGSGVDNAVLSIGRFYDNLNRVQNLTSYASGNDRAKWTHLRGEKIA